MQTNNLLTESVSKIFFRYLIPAILANMVTSIYILADTIIIGKGIDTLAMAALNIILPLFNIFFGVGLLFGVGGSVLMSIARGRGDEQLGKCYFTLCNFACYNLSDTNSVTMDFHEACCALFRCNRSNAAIHSRLCTLCNLGLKRVCFFFTFTNLCKK